MKIIKANLSCTNKRGASFTNSFKGFSPWRRLYLFTKKLVGDRSGVIVIMFALMLPVLLGIIGIGVEIGNWYQSKRGLQSAADAAAIAAAFGVKHGSNEADAYTKAVYEAERNWGDTFSIAEFDTDIMPPVSGSYTADTSAVEVNLSKSVSLMFIKYLMSSSSIEVNARAVATVQEGGEACVLSLDTSGVGVGISGNGNVTFDNCVTAANSSDPSVALDSTGSGSLTTDCYHVVGAVSDTSQMTFDSDCVATDYGKTITDPYEALTEPGSACDQGALVHDTAGSTVTYDGSFADPYVFCGDLWVKKGTVILKNGIFIIDGGDLKSNALGNFVTQNATVILRNGAQINNFNGSSTVTMSAPTSTTISTDMSTPGVWEDIMIYQDRNSGGCTGNNCNTLNGNSSSTFDGVIYFPSQEINVSGGNVSTGSCMHIVAYRVAFTGNSDVVIDNNDCGFSKDIKVPGTIRLVE